MIRRYEEISNNAWPALQTILYDGWLLRFAEGVTKRSNSVSMLYPSTINPLDKIQFCESLYKEQGIAPCFKVTSVSDPANIDELLENHGYYIHSYVSFQVLESEGFHNLQTGYFTEDKVVAGQELSPGWIENFIRMNGFESSGKPVYVAIMQQVKSPKCLVSVYRDERCIAVGLGVIENGFTGIFDIVVDPAYRNEGHATTVMKSILQWGKDNGATRAYLQVMSNNLPALNLYRKLGFRELYQYWYRMKNL